MYSDDMMQRNGRPGRSLFALRLSRFVQCCAFGNAFASGDWILGRRRRACWVHRPDLGALCVLERASPPSDSGTGRSAQAKAGSKTGLERIRKRRLVAEQRGGHVRSTGVSGDATLGKGCLLPPLSPVCPRNNARVRLALMLSETNVKRERVRVCARLALFAVCL